jgi:hypothetical protein
LAAIAAAWLSTSQDDNWNDDCDIASPSGIIDLNDFGVLAKYWQFNK